MSEQYAYSDKDKSIKVDIITGRGHADIKQGTRIENGNNVSITLATRRSEDLDMKHPDGKTLKEKTVQYVEQNPFVTNHAEQFALFKQECIENEVASIKGRTFVKDGQTITYKDDMGDAKSYDIMAKAVGTPDALPQVKDVLSIQSASVDQVKGQNFNIKKDFINEVVNPYDNFYNQSPDKRRTYQQTVGGADLSVFYMAEYPNMEDVLDGVHPSAQRKELVIFELDSALSLSYSILRERFPVRTIGRANPVAYTRGSRTIAGHIAFAVFAEDVLTRLRSRIRNKFSEISNKFVDFSSKDNISTADGQSRAGTDAEQFTRMRRLYEMAFEYDKVQLLDSLPPFHLLIMGVNESGVWSKFIIKNVCIVDENQYQGTQQPNIVNKVSWVASDIIPMASFGPKGFNVQESLNSVQENYTSGRLSISAKFNMLTGTSILESIQSDLAKDQVDNPNTARRW